MQFYFYECNQVIDQFGGFALHFRHQMAINIESDTDLRVPKPVGHNDNWCARGLLRRENTLQYQAHSAKTQDLASPRQMGWSGCRDARSPAPKLFSGCVSTKAHPEKRIIAGDLASHSRYIVMRHLCRTSFTHIRVMKTIKTGQFLTLMRISLRRDSRCRGWRGRLRRG